MHPTEWRQQAAPKTRPEAVVEDCRSSIIGDGANLQPAAVQCSALGTCSPRAAQTCSLGCDERAEVGRLVRLQVGSGGLVWPVKEGLPLSILRYDATG